MFQLSNIADVLMRFIEQFHKYVKYKAKVILLFARAHFIIIYYYKKKILNKTAALFLYLLDM